MKGACARMKIEFTQEEAELMKKAGITFNVKGNLSEEYRMEIDMVVTDYLIENGIEEDESVNEIGKLCEQILEKV